MDEIRVEECQDCGIVHEVERWELPDGEQLMLCDECRQKRRRDENPDPFGLEDYAMSLFRDEGECGGHDE